MTRRRFRSEGPVENHDRWLVSYADLITLLFALFVVMFASSQTDAAKMSALVRSVNQAFKTDPTALPVDPQAELSKSSEALQSALASEIAAGTIGITMDARGLVISLQEKAFFPSGQDSLLPEAVPSMDKIAQIIQHLPNPIRLEGHTDSVPISNGRFRSNWELAAARGIAVLNTFVEAHGVPPERLAVVAYADTIPKASNDTEEGRAGNRRVDVTILNEVAVKKEASSAFEDGQRNATEREQR